MKINYDLIRKIHLYASLTTVVILLMFIVTSYVMIHHDWFDHEASTSTEEVVLEGIPVNESEWEGLIRAHDIEGREYLSRTNDRGELVKEFGRAAGFTRITLSPDGSAMEIFRSDKSTADAFIGIHRVRGYSGPWQYKVYAFLLDVLGVSLVLFTITGVIMWMKLLKHNKIAWIIFIGGFIYFALNVVLLMYW